ncbi:hypothetical protein HC891_18620 [Candidatus Gracilibacteria bacterium]|nr:hypothetical protein [Candidatus Gracilibacteria bacterium]
MNKPVHIGLAGADAALILQLTRCTPGLRLVAVADPQLEAVIVALRQAAIVAPRLVTNAAQLDAAAARGHVAVLEDVTSLGQAATIDIVVDATGSVLLGAEIALAAFAHTKALLVLYPALMVSLGPVLHGRAQQAATPLVFAHGSPALALIEVYRFVSDLGLRPRLAGICGAADLPLLDLVLAANWLDLALLPTPLDVAPGQALTSMALPEQLREQAQLAYVRAAPPAVFVFAEAAFPQQAALLEQAGLGKGPLFCFTQAAGFGFLAIARAIQSVKYATQPQLLPRYTVAGRTHKPLPQGHSISAGDCEPWLLALAESSVAPLPYALAMGCRLRYNIGPGEIVRWGDITPPTSAAARLYAEQIALLHRDERV